jgi:hypothetical protein
MLPLTSKDRLLQKVILIVLTCRVIWKNSSAVDKTKRLGGSERHSEDSLVSQKVTLKGKTFGFFENQCWGQKGTVLIF